MKTTKTKLISAFLVVALIGVMAGCGKEQAQNPVADPIAPVVDVTQEPTTLVDPWGDTPYWDRVNDQGKVHSYLTGKWVDKTVRDTRPVSFMIENTKEALPHYSITKAAIVYESPVEGSITRLMAIFEDAANAGLDRIGNVRSARPYYINSALQYDCIYAHAGQSIHAKVMFDQKAIDNLNGLEDKIANAMFYRSNDKESPHNYYAKSSGIAKAIEADGYRTTLRSNYEPMFWFTEDHESNDLNELNDLSGEPCEAFQMYYFYNQPYLIYNAEDKKYYKYEFGAPEMDAATNTQLSFDNIIIQECDYTMYEETPYLNINLVGSGKGKYITHGKMIDIKWDRYALDCNTVYSYAKEGYPIALNQGNTLILFSQTQYADQSKFYATKAEFDAAH